MSDVVVTVPKRLWAEWLEEGDLAEPSRLRHPAPRRGVLEYQYEFRFGGRRLPKIENGERVYIVAWGRLRGWAPLEDLVIGRSSFSLIRGPGDHARAVTVTQPISGFRGWRYRWWDLNMEHPFPGWKTEGVAL